MIVLYSDRPMDRNRLIPNDSYSIFNLWHLVSDEHKYKGILILRNLLR